LANQRQIFMYKRGRIDHKFFSLKLTTWVPNQDLDQEGRRLVSKIKFIF